MGTLWVVSILLRITLAPIELNRQMKSLAISTAGSWLVASISGIPNSLSLIKSVTVFD